MQLLSDGEIEIITRTAGTELPKMGSNRFFEPLYQLKTGQRSDAARGLEDRMCVQAIRAIYFERVVREVEGIQDEVDSFAASSQDPDLVELRNSLHYIRFETTSERVYDTGVRDQGRDAMSLLDFLNNPKATQASLSEAEVVAIRLYTFVGYIFMNMPLRDDERYARGEPCPLPVTTHFAESGLRKLRGLHINGSEMTLWRGLRNLEAADDFMTLGGTDLGFMSMTMNLGVAVRYSLSQQSLLFKVTVPDFMTMGADVQWLSAFPSEREILYPPLTYLKPTGRTQAIDSIITSSCIARSTCNAPHSGQCRPQQHSIFIHLETVFCLQVVQVERNGQIFKFTVVEVYLYLG